MIISNELSGQQVRVNESLIRIIDRLDGHRSIGLALDAAGIETDEERHHALRAVQTLITAGLLVLVDGIDDERLLAQRRLLAKSTGIGRLRNPLAIRVPLHDPQRWLDRLVPLTRPIFSTTVAILWLVLMTLVASMTWLHSVELGEELTAVLGSPAEWWFYLFLYPLLKGVHETAHAVCVRRWGGQVHEMGISLLVLMPVPYVDASDASMFASRRHRLLTSAAGMLAEVTLAGLALLLWCLIEPGLIRDACFALAILGSLPTLVFNANPLMRFDGYQILQDALDMPNLATRASRYLLDVFKRTLLGLRSEVPVATAHGETGWLLTYGVAALLWRWVVTFGIAAWLWMQLPIVGAALALFALYQLLCRPLLNAVRWLAHSPELEGRRRTSSLRSLALATGVIVSFVAIPLPSTTRTTGEIWAEGPVELLVPEAGVVRKILVTDGASVSAGEVIAYLDSPALQLQYRQQAADIALMEARRASALMSDAVESRILKRELQGLDRELSALAQRREHLVITARVPGRFVADETSAMVGRHVDKGDVLGHVVSPSRLRIRSVIEEAQFGRWLDGVTNIRVRLGESVSRVHPATLFALTPAADRTLPSPALAAAQGGGVAVDHPGRRTGAALQTRAPVFHVDLRLPAGVQAAGVGGRAYVSFEHEAESLARRCWRRFRQLFIQQITV